MPDQRHCGDMKRLRRSSSLLVLCLAGGLLAACATPAGPGSAADAPGGQSLGSLDPGLPENDVIGQGTVLEDSGGVRLCAVVMESHPPQCGGGVALVDWTWEGVEGSTSSNDVVWGSYAVQGTYDGDALTVTQPPILLALYDPMAPEDPTGGVPGDTDEATLVEIQEEAGDRLGAALVSSWPQDGRLWVQVTWDDGTWQDAADADFGEEVVVVQSWLREVDASS